jgi:hypothetical protein
MKFVTTVLCSIIFAIAGISLAISENNTTVSKHATVSAATVPQYNFPTLPLDVQLDLNKKYNKPDTVYLDNYTAVLPPRPEKIVTKVKRIYLPAPTQEDTGSIIPIDSAKNKVGGAREEYTPDTIGPPKGSIILVVDGEEVYKR